MKWNIYDDVKDNDFKPLVDLILNKNESFNIDGRAGTGKTFLINELKNEMTKRGLKFKSLAPTNKACRLINGQTLHNFILKFKSKNSIDNLKIDYIFIDEISMMKEIFYNFLIFIKTINTKIKFILTGDFRQLPPVNDRIKIDYKNCIALYEICDGNKLKLKTCRRTDQEFFELCKFKNIKLIKTDTFNNKKNLKNICFTHKKRIEINKEKMDKIKEIKIRNGSHDYIEIKANLNDPHSQDVLLTKDVPIIAHVNCKQLNISNNETFKIIKIHFDYITILNDKKKIIIEKKDFQKLFYVAYAVTCHSSQGDTINEPYSIHEWERMSLKMKYVALTRSTKKEYINIIYE
jgi:nucleoside-triphosphatase THEP1